MLTNLKENDIILAIQKYGIDIVENCLYQEVFDRYLTTVNNEKLDYPIPKIQLNLNNWFLPAEYKNMNIENWLRNICPKENINRLNEEIEMFKQHNMLSLLKTMKYLVDIFRENNILWGVGRGSSVASYTLFLIGIHKIDSVKYDLPITEFFKGEKDGKTI